MKELIIYQLEVASCLALFYVFYILLLRKETNFSVKRAYFICTGILAFVLPALNIQFSISTEEIPIEYINILPSQLISYTPTIIQADKVDAWMLMSVLWGAGCAILLFRLFISLSNIGKILKGTTNCPAGYPIKITNDKVQSFSFFKIIVLNAQHYHSKAMKFILAHEQAHSDQYHSIDVLMVELLKTIQWFNPFAWLFGKESLQNLEYLADQEVANSLHSAQDYQMAIVNHSGNSASQLLRSEFSKSNLKKRIIMMNQQKRKKINPAKLILLLPIIGVLFLSFSMKIENLDLRKEVAEILPQIVSLEPENLELNKLPSLDKTTSDAKHKLIDSVVPMDTITESIEEVIFQNETPTSDDSIKEVFTVVDNQPTPSTGGYMSYYEVINKDLNYPEEEKRNNIAGKVFVQFIVQKDGTLREVKALKGISPACNAEAVRVIKDGPIWNAGQQRGRAVDVKMILPITFGATIDNKIPKRPEHKLNNEVFTIVEDQPYPSTGDIVSYYEFLYAQLTYPKQAADKEIKGKVFVQFIVQKDGTLREVKAVKGLGYGCDEEAIRLLQEGPKWVSGKQRGQSVDVRMILPIYFGMPHEFKQKMGTRTIKGSVISEGGFPIPGANVTIVGTKSGTKTNSNGNFVLKINSEDHELLFTSNGFNSKLVDLSNRDELTVELKARTEQTKDQGIAIRQDGQDLLNLAEEDRPLMIMNEEEIDFDKFMKLGPHGIQQIEVLKGKPAVKKYGEKAKNGVIIITTKE